jgi:sugar transferase (PEP-CTERM/EpsH1 system associated)
MARILMLAPQLPHSPHLLDGVVQGTTIRNFHFLAGLTRRHRVDLLTFASGGADVTESAGDDLRSYCSSVVVEKAPVRSLARRGVDTLLNARPDMALRLESPAMRASLRRLLAQHDYDVVQVEGIEMAPYAATVRGSGRGALLVFDDHNAEYLLQKRAFTTDVRLPSRWLGAAYSLVQWRKLVGYERRTCRGADRVVAVSEPDRQALERIAPGLQVTVIPNGVDLDFFRADLVAPHPDLGPSSLVFTGKMDYRPNVDAVLWFVDDVLPLIRKQQPEAHFWAVGQQPHERLQRLADHPGVTLTGRVPDVRPYISAAGAYVAPLRIGGGTRLKVLEALAMGQAIVSTRLGCDGFPLTDGREVRFADDAGDFADVVVALLRDRQQARALGLAGRKFVESHYGWDALVPLLEALYR